LPADPKDATSAPKLVFKNGGVLDVQLLGGNKLLISSTSFLDNSLFFSVGPAAAVKSNATKGTTLILANLKNGTTYGLSQSQVGEVFYKGAGDYFVHAWIIKPSFFKENETYPLAFYIHGDPQGATDEVWR
jgi:dipeptidyl aminopeptidase/acylaminoacyl peptidase